MSFLSFTGSPAGVTLHVFSERPDGVEVSVLVFDAAGDARSFSITGPGESLALPPDTRRVAITCIFLEPEPNRVRFYVDSADGNRLGAFELSGNRPGVSEHAELSFGPQSRGGDIFGNAPYSAEGPAESRGPQTKNAFPSAAPKNDDAEYTVFYGTNRARIDEADPSRGYSANRGKRIDYGSCRIFVPKSHKIGSTGSPWWKRLLTMKDDRLKLLGIQGMTAEAHWHEMQELARSLSEDERHAVVFVHGYNVTFEEAALRAAQIGFDLSIKGPMAFFSWPSQGTLLGYPADEATIEVSEDAIESYLSDFAVRCGAKHVHLIAHSMGNRGVMRAIDRIASRAHERTGVAFDQIILAAADVDADKFRTLADAYAKVARRTTLYVSEKDLAVGASFLIRGFPRLGFTPPVFVVDDIDTVSVSNIDLTLLGHGYVGAAREVLTDMHELIFDGKPPGQRFSLTPATTPAGERYWLIRA